MSDEDYYDYPDEDYPDEDYPDENYEDDQQYDQQYQFPQDEQQFTVSYRQMQETMYIKDACADSQILGDLRQAPKNRIYYEEIFKIQVCEYLQQINSTIPSDSTDKFWLVSPKTLQKIPNINYKNVIGYTLGYFAIDTRNKIISVKQIDFIKNNMVNLRLNNMNVVLRYARLWEKLITQL